MKKFYLTVPLRATRSVKSGVYIDSSVCITPWSRAAVYMYDTAECHHGMHHTDEFLICGMYDNVTPEFFVNLNKVLLCGMHDTLE